MERIRRGKTDKAIHALEWKKITARRKYHAIHSAQLFDTYKYHTSERTYYSARRVNVISRPAMWDAEDTDKELAKLYAPQLIEKLPNASDIL